MQLTQSMVEYQTTHNNRLYKFIVRSGKGVTVYRTASDYFIPPSTQTPSVVDGKLVWMSLMNPDLRIVNFSDLDEAVSFVKEN